MGRRSEKAAQGDHETLIARVSWLWEHRRDLPVDLLPGPSGQWYFADWTSDPKVRRMSRTARGVHMDCICDAWAEHPPCSLPADGEDFEDVFADVEDRDRRTVLRAWVSEGGRIWQPGLCKTCRVPDPERERRDDVRFLGLEAVERALLEVKITEARRRMGEIHGCRYDEEMGPLVDKLRRLRGRGVDLAAVVLEAGKVLSPVALRKMTAAYADVLEETD